MTQAGVVILMAYTLMAIQARLTTPVPQIPKEMMVPLVMFLLLLLVPRVPQWALLLMFHKGKEIK